MKIIIVGMGDKGTMLADMLSQEKHDVVVIDSDKEKVESVTGLYSVSGVVGSGVSKEILLKAGADTADIILCMTPIDEVNLMICMVAKKCGTRYAGARLFQPELSADKEYLEKEFQVDYIINPKLETAHEIMMQIGLPGRVRADAFFDSTAAIIRVTVEEGMLPAEAMSLQEFKAYLGMDALVVTILRDNDLIVPDGNSKVQKGDILGVLVEEKLINSLIMKLGLIKKPAKRVFIVGGGDIAYYLAKQLTEAKMKVSVMENDKKRCLDLAEQLPDVQIAYANGLKAEVLLQEGLKDADACVSLTGSDENNLVISLFAWSCGTNSIITKVDSMDYEKLLNRVNMDITISPNVITANGMMGFVRNIAVYNSQGKDILGIHQLAGGMAEAVEFQAYENTRCLGIPFKSPKFKLKKNLLIGMIVREGKAIVPGGNQMLQAGDRVIVITRRKQKFSLNTLNDIFD